MCTLGRPNSHPAGASDLLAALYLMTLAFHQAMNSTVKQVSVTLAQPPGIFPASVQSIWPDTISQSWKVLGGFESGHHFFCKVPNRGLLLSLGLTV